MVRKVDLFPAPAALELKKAIIISVAASKRQPGRSRFLQAADSLPHHQIVGPQVLKLRIGSAKFVNRVGTKLEKH